jgi:hypothetical protein
MIYVGGPVTPDNSVATSEYYLAVSVKCWKLGEEKEGLQRRVDLISATIGHDAIGNETALQLIMPIW